MGLLDYVAHVAEPQGSATKAAMARVLAAGCTRAGCKAQSQLCLLIDVYIHASHASTPHMQSGVIWVKIVENFCSPVLPGDFSNLADLESILGDINTL
jgi:hypothetical protein